MTCLINYAGLPARICEKKIQNHMQNRIKETGAK